MTLTLYMTPASPPVRAVLLLAAYLGIALDLKEVNVLQGEQLKPEFLKMNPQHTVPTLDDDGNVIWDSHAIMGYLADKYAKDDSVYPKNDPYKRAMIDQRMHFENGIVFNQIHILIMKFLKGDKTISDENKEQGENIYGLLEKFLEGRKWMAGDSPTLADFSLIPSVTTYSLFIPFDAGKYPNLKAWLNSAKETFTQYEDINEKGINLIKATIMA